MVAIGKEADHDRFGRIHADHQIQLHEPEHAHGRHFPIDRFFRSLADSVHPSETL